MIVKKTYLLVLLILITIGATAQKNTTHQSLYWLRYYNQLTFNKRIVWQNEFENRRFFEKNQQHTFIIQSHLHYKAVKSTDVAIGMTYSLQSPQDPNSTSDLVIPEISPYQEINLVNTYTKRFTLQERLRLDERFIHENNGQTLTDGYDFNFRFRLRLQANYRMNKGEVKNPTNLKIADEVMINAGNNIVYNQFDQNRIYAGLEQGLTKNIAIELGYMYLYQQRASGKDFFERDIIRLTLLHKIKI